MDGGFFQTGAAPDDPNTQSGSGDKQSRKRKHQPGLSRVQIACERCRTRKNKCDGQLPTCSTCKKAGAECVVLDRLTWKQHPRGHVDALERENEMLRTRVRSLEQAANATSSGVEQHESRQLVVDHQPEAPWAAAHQPAGLPSNNELPAEYGRATLEDSPTQPKYVGESGGGYLGNIMQKMLLQADYKHEQGPSHSRLRMRIHQDGRKASPLSSRAAEGHCDFPSAELAPKLEESYFTVRWAALPFLHRPTFREKHLQPVLQLGRQADSASLFLVFLVFALAAIDLDRSNTIPKNIHHEYFGTAMAYYLDGILQADSEETVQGLLLISQFAVSEAQSVNAWQAAGQAVRAAVDLGLHRSLPNESHSQLQQEMRKRIFWSAYALDRNISLALGRPCALKDSDINIPLPLLSTDEELCAEQPIPPGQRPSHPRDMSSFIHIIRLRQHQSKIQDVFYAASPPPMNKDQVEAQQHAIRGELDTWIGDAPRYLTPNIATYQSTEWFQIAYSHSLLLLYRPSPASPSASFEALQICADSAISLISSYSSLYAKNKITYTWIALHSLFMASITMFYTLWISPDIRKTTRQMVVKSNVTLCLMLFEAMRDVWPLAARCFEIIERLGAATVKLFDPAPVDSRGQQIASAGDGGPLAQDGALSREYAEWFGTGDRNAGGAAIGPQPHNVPNEMPVNEFNTSLGELFPDLDELVHQGFDLTLPIMTDAFDQPIWSV